MRGQIGNPKGEDKPNKSYYDPRKWVPDGYDDHSLMIIFACNRYGDAAHKAGLKDLDCAVADGKLLKKTLAGFGFKG